MIKSIKYKYKQNLRNIKSFLNFLSFVYLYLNINNKIKKFCYKFKYNKEFLSL